MHEIRQGADIAANSLICVSDIYRSSAASSVPIPAPVADIVLGLCLGGLVVKFPSSRHQWTCTEDVILEFCAFIGYTSDARFAHED
ncbi:MAG: hypothetical protein ABSC38_06950 [Verrucomicrobiia bacterium]